MRRAPPPLKVLIPLTDNVEAMASRLKISAHPDRQSLQSAVHYHLEVTLAKSSHNADPEDYHLALATAHPGPVTPVTAERGPLPPGSHARKKLTQRRSGGLPPGPRARHPRAGHPRNERHRSARASGRRQADSLPVEGVPDRSAAGQQPAQSWPLRYLRRSRGGHGPESDRRARSRMRSRARQRWTGPIGGLLSGFAGEPVLSRLWLRHQLSVRSVPADLHERLPARAA